MRKNKKAVMAIAAAALLAALFFGGKYALDLKYYKEAMAEIIIHDVDLSRIKDGTYVGSYDARLISAKVRVTVENGKMINIKLLEYKYDKGGPAVAVVDEILTKQAVNVDAVSGATNSSKTIMKAVENALNSGKEDN